MITRTLRAERAVAAAWASHAPVQGTRYEVAVGNESVAIYAEDDRSLARAVASLAGPTRFELVSMVDHSDCNGFNAQWHCPFCGSTVTVGSYNITADLAFIERDLDGAITEHEDKREECRVSS